MHFCFMSSRTASFAACAWSAVLVLVLVLVSVSGSGCEPGDELQFEEASSGASILSASLEIEAEAVAGGTVQNETDASAGQAVTRNASGIYTWWTVPSANLTRGARYAVYMRARSIDGASHVFSEHLVIDGTSRDVFNVSVSKRAFHWYCLGTFAMDGSSLRLSDWSANGLVIDKLRLEAIEWTEAEQVAGGTVVQDSSASGGAAVGRSQSGIYTWWLPNASALRHGMYTLRVRARSVSGQPVSFSESSVVDGVSSTHGTLSIAGASYAWYDVAQIEYKGTAIRLADWSSAGLYVDELRLVPNKPYDATLALYHAWYGNASLGGTLQMEAERVNGGGEQVQNPNASHGVAVSRSTSGIYAWWVVDRTTLIPNAHYALDVRARSPDGRARSFGEYVVLNGHTTAAPVVVSSREFTWHKVTRFVFDGSALRISDWSEAGLEVDALRLVQEGAPGATDDFQRIGFYASGQPNNTVGLGDAPGRVSVVETSRGHVNAYFRQSVVANETFATYMGISSDGGATFAVQPSPIISVPKSLPGGQQLVTAYDPDVIKRSDGYLMVLEGAGSIGFSSIVAFSPNGITDWALKNVLVQAPYGLSASTPNLFEDIDSGRTILGWVSVDNARQVTSHHQALLHNNVFETITQNPAIGALPQSPSTAWDGMNFGSANVMLEDDFAYMFFEGATNYGCDGQWGLGMARAARTAAATPTSWQKHQQNPILMADYATSCWMSYPEIVKIADTYYLYYDDSGANWSATQVFTNYRRRINLP